jgi:hypothetical protein
MLQQRTLAVNDVGIAFAAAARQRGGTCGPLDWIPEVARQIRRGCHLICDALIDRATMPVTRLAAKVAAHAEYAGLRRPGRPGYSSRGQAVRGRGTATAIVTPRRHNTTRSY